MFANVLDFIEAEAEWSTLLDFQCLIKSKNCVLNFTAERKQMEQGGKGAEQSAWFMCHIFFTYEDRCFQQRHQKRQYHDWMSGSVRELKLAEMDANGCGICNEIKCRSTDGDNVGFSFKSSCWSRIIFSRFTARGEFIARTRNVTIGLLPSSRIDFCRVAFSRHFASQRQNDIPTAFIYCTSTCLIVLLLAILSDRGHTIKHS